MKTNIMGIYKISNKINGKFYIGSSNNIKRRWEQHIRDLNTNQHDNNYLQNAWNKNSQKNFEFTIIEEVVNEDDLLDVEQVWLDETQCFNPYIGYNLSINTRLINSKFIKLRENIIKSEEDTPLYYEDNDNLMAYSNSDTRIPTVDNLNVLLQKIYEFYYHKLLQYDEDGNNLNQLSNCKLYTEKCNFDLENIIKSKVRFDLFLKTYNVEMIRIEDYHHNSESLNIYKNTFIWFKIHDDILTLQTPYRQESIKMSK